MTTPKIGKTLVFDCENNAGIPMPSEIKLKRNWRNTIVPINVSSRSAATPIHTPKNIKSAFKETQKEMIPKTECPCLSIRKLTFAFDN